MFRLQDLKTLNTIQIRVKSWMRLCNKPPPPHQISLLCFFAFICCICIFMLTKINIRNTNQLRFCNTPPPSHRTNTNKHHYTNINKMALRNYVVQHSSAASSPHRLSCSFASFCISSQIRIFAFFVFLHTFVFAFIYIYMWLYLYFETLYLHLYLSNTTPAFQLL